MASLRLKRVEIYHSNIYRLSNNVIIISTWITKRFFFVYLFLLHYLWHHGVSPGECVIPHLPSLRYFNNVNHNIRVKTENSWKISYGEAKNSLNINKIRQITNFTSQPPPSPIKVGSLCPWLRPISISCFSGYKEERYVKAPTLPTKDYPKVIVQPSNGKSRRKKEPTIDLELQKDGDVS